MSKFHKDSPFYTNWFIPWIVSRLKIRHANCHNSGVKRMFFHLHVLTHSFLSQTTKINMKTLFFISKITRENAALYLVGIRLFSFTNKRNSTGKQVGCLVLVCSDKGCAEVLYFCTMSWYFFHKRLQDKAAIQLIRMWALRVFSSENF